MEVGAGVAAQDSATAGLPWQLATGWPSWLRQRAERKRVVTGVVQAVLQAGRVSTRQGGFDLEVVLERLVDRRQAIATVLAQRKPTTSEPTQNIPGLTRTKAAMC